MNKQSVLNTDLAKTAQKGQQTDSRSLHLNVIFDEANIKYNQIV